jgi:hypothetical protein
MVSGGSLGNMLDAIREKKRVLQESPRLIADQLADDLIAELKSTVPRETGTLASAITEKVGPIQIGDGWRVGVGPLSRLGRPTDDAPRGTIAAFLKDHADAYYEEVAAADQAAYEQRLEARKEKAARREAERAETERRRQKIISDKRYKLGDLYSRALEQLRIANEQSDRIDKAYEKILKLLAKGGNKRIVASRLARERRILERRRANRQRIREIKERLNRIVLDYNDLSRWLGKKDFLEKH